MNQSVMNLGHHCTWLTLVLFTLSLPLPAANRAETTRRYAVYRSDDQGRSWSRSDAGLPSGARINAFTSSEKSLIAGTDAGIFVSTNTGKSWQPSALPDANNGRITSLASLNGATAGLLFAGTAEGFLLSSSDQGKTWQPNPSFPRRNIRSLHALEGTLYVGTDADHVFRSPDLGKTWAHLAAGLPSDSQVFALSSLAGRLFAGLYADGLYTWIPADQKWLRVGEGSKDDISIRPLALATVGPTLIAGHNPGGIYWSDDLGETWKHWSLPLASTPPADTAIPFPSLDSILNNDSTVSVQSPIWEMSANATAPNIVIAGAASAIYYSTDRARTWTRATAGLPSAAPGIAFLIKDGLILAAIHEKPHEKPSTCASSN